MIPRSTKEFYIIIYANKTKLSSFGMEKGYLAHCANLPVLICYRKRIGGRLVGWLFIVSTLTYYLNLNNRILKLYIFSPRNLQAKHINHTLSITSARYNMIVL